MRFVAGATQGSFNFLNGSGPIARATGSIHEPEHGPLRDPIESGLDDGRDAPAGLAPRQNASLGSIDVKGAWRF